MSVLKLEPNTREKILYGAIEKLAESKHLSAPSLAIELEASAISDQIGYVKQLLIAIAADDGISDKIKGELTAFLAEISLTLKRAIQGGGIRAGGLTASVQKGHVLTAMSAVAG
jgi:hypothetical protein